MTVEERAERAAFLESRRTGIGGSDVASLLQPFLSEGKDAVKYGCRRQLWLNKSNVSPDYPDEDTGPMRLGRILEPHIAAWHTEASGDRLSEPGLTVHPDHPELLVHIDRMVEDDAHDAPGAAEIKALGPDMFWQVKREGIVTDYLLQLQMGILLADAVAAIGPQPKARVTWGKFIVGNRAYGGVPLSWIHNADKDIHEAILEEGPAFWKTLGDESKAPERLRPDDRRCGVCAWRKTCQGNALMEAQGQDIDYADDLRPLLIEYDTIAAKFCVKLPDDSKGTEDDLRLLEIKERIKDALGARQAVAVGWPGKDRKLYFRPQSGRVSWKMDDLLRAYELMRKSLPAADNIPPAESFKREGVPFRVLRIF